ncbi:MAG: TRAP transporter small permease subunit [Pseudomonadota bacterium]
MKREAAFQPGAVMKLLHAVAALALVAACLLQVVIVALRAVGTGLLWGQELVVTLGAIAVQTGSAPSFAHDRLVRIDVISANRSRDMKRWVERFGTFLLLVPFAVCLVWFGWSYALESWRIGEGSAEISGLPGRFVLKSLIPIFALALLMAGVLRWQQR